MAKVTPERVEKLQKRTGLSKRECREYLRDADGDLELARFIASTVRAAAEFGKANRQVRKRRLNDPVFGRMTWHWSWKGRSAASTLARKVEVTVESADATPPDERQRAAYREFLSRERELAPQLTAAHFRHYKKIRKVWGGQFGADELEEIAPALASADQVVARLSHPIVHVPSSRSAAGRSALTGPAHGILSTATRRESATED